MSRRVQRRRPSRLPVAAEPSLAGGTYTVKPGDTLAKIAAATGTSVQALMQANGIKQS